MSAPNPNVQNPALYAASCNPPRRAKRQRTGSLGTDAPLVPASAPAPAPAIQPRRNTTGGRLPILPKQPVTERDYAPPASPDSESNSDEEDDYDPGREVAPPPKRRGRKPGTMSRSARESLRKLNHSRIEKARRTKINETLATLSTLVSDRERLFAGEGRAVSEVHEEESAKKKGKGKPEEKEFKLDVLVKTVEYMQELVARVQALETQLGTQCRIRESPRASVPPSPKRKRHDDLDYAQPVARRPRQMHDDDDSYGGDDEHGLGAPEEEQPSPMPFVTPASSSSAQTSSPCLPPIASWLPHPYLDPSSLMNASPQTMPARSPGNAQLPSPPLSGPFRPTITLANMPALTLPGPAHPLRAPPSSQKVPTTTAQRKSISASPTVSPTWTPEDETAASLLLQMSSKPRSNSSASSSSASGGSSVLAAARGVLPMTPREEVGQRERAFGRPVEVVTPGSLLGMRD